MKCKYCGEVVQSLITHRCNPFVRAEYEKEFHIKDKFRIEDSSFD